MQNRMSKKKKLDLQNIGKMDILDVSDLLGDIDSLVRLDEQTTDALEPKYQEEAAAPDYSEEWLRGRGFRDEQIVEIRKGVERMLPVERYAKTCYNWMQMREIRLGMLEEVQTDLYENPYFSAEQMHEIRMGLVEGLDVSGYARLLYTERDMAKARKALLQEMYSLNPRKYAKTCMDEDSGIQIRISNDCMEAFVTFTREIDLTAGEVKKILARNDVVFGIDERVLDNELQRKRYGQEFRVAQGSKGTKGLDGRFVFMFNPLLPGKPTELADGSVDYTKVVEAEKVATGDVLVQYYPAVPPQEGRTVTGIPIQGKPGRELPPFSGQGFRINRENNTYVATVDGFVVLDEDKGMLNVWNIFIVNEDVNRYNGHITYDGIIHIKGNVGDMAVIEASGNIVVEGVVESAQLIAGENVIIKGGVNGGERGFIKAGMRVLGKFFESVEINAGGDVEANYFMNCDIQTDGQLIARGRKGRIIGGRLHILGGVEAVSIGNYNSINAILDVGNSAQTDDRRLEVLSKLNKIEKELKHLEAGKEKLSDMLGESISQTNELFQKICSAINVLENQKAELQNGIRYLDALVKRAAMASIVVHGNLQEGVKIVICGKRKDIDKTVNGRVIIKREAKGE